MSRSQIFFAFVLVALTPSEAHADVAPANSCTSAGQSCTNAKPDYHTPGTCQASTCYRSVPAPDGGRQTQAYDCTLCVTGTGSGGAGAGGGAGTGGSAGASDAGAKTGTGGSSDSGCACIVSPARAGGAMAALMLGAGALALLVDRRSRRR